MTITILFIGSLTIEPPLVALIAIILITAHSINKYYAYKKLIIDANLAQGTRIQAIN